MKKNKVRTFCYGKNFIRLHTPRFARHRLYMFPDVNEYFADNIFIDMQLPVHFRRGEYLAPGTPYRVILVDVPKKHETLFKEAMNRLCSKMLLCGHKDYLEFSNDLIEKLYLQWVDENARQLCRSVNIEEEEATA